MSRARAGRRYAAVLTVGLVALVLASGVAAGTTVPPCPSNTLTQPFLPWGDPGLYFLGPDGSEESTATWSLSGGAARVSGNEPYYVNSSSDRRSLYLPSGSSAETAATCVTIHDPTLRLFVRNTGSFMSALKVEVIYTDMFGNERSAQVALLVGGSSWQPSLPMLFLQCIAPTVGVDDQTWVSFRFTPVGWGGNWQIDDLYVDPLKMG